MVLPSYLSQNHRERTRKGRRRRRLKFTPILLIIVTTILTVRALIGSMTIVIPTADKVLSIPIDNIKLPIDIIATASSLIINGWERLKPSHGGSVYGEIDFLTTGKSCIWQPSRFYYTNKLLSWIFFFSRASFFGQWVCRDCGEQHLESRKWENCKILNRRGKCPEFAFQGWDEPKPRSASTYDTTSSIPYPIRLIISYGVGKVRKVEYEQPQCLSLEKPCFDMDRCTTLTVNGTVNNQKLIQPLPVFAYPGQALYDLEEALDQSLSSPDKTDSTIPTTKIRIVEDPRISCLLISHIDDIKQVKASPSWNLGINHYVYGVTKPIEENIHFDMAALGSAVLTNAQVRTGFDISLPLPALWKISTLQNSRMLDDLHRPRQFLLTFKGSIQDTQQPYYQHRWLAAEYLYDESDVSIDVQCKHKTLWGDTVTFASYDNPSQKNFDNFMLNSTFSFSPGGSHVTSFRFTEVLSAGSIPVLLPEIVTPFFPELDWESCVIRVSQARIVDLPRILRGIKPDSIRTRQVNCRRLYRDFLHQKGIQKSDVSRNYRNQSPEATSGLLTTALKVWQLRLEKQNYSNRLQSRFFSSTK